MKDTRIAYGARCTWWDSIQNVGKHGRLPCCPQCGNVLYEMPDEATWYNGATRYEAEGHPGYRAMVEWARGKCFANYAELKAAYKAELKQ
jgi:hypothetical protein